MILNLKSRRTMPIKMSSSQPTRLHNCGRSLGIECLIFSFVEIKDIPDEPCPICYGRLREPGDYGCCGTYAGKLLCGHFVHVGCHIDYNPKFRYCSVCKADLLKNINK